MGVSKTSDHIPIKFKMNMNMNMFYSLYVKYAAIKSLKNIVQGDILPIGRVGYIKLIMFIKLRATF